MAISVEQALELIYTNIHTKTIKILPIEEALGFILAQDIYASHNLPPFDNSAMDGYAVKVDDSEKKVKVTHTILAGDNFVKKLQKGTAIKIMTGARIPRGTEAIVPFEDVKIFKEHVTLPSDISFYKHIRVTGEDIKKDKKLLKKGKKLDAHQMTLLASQGISHIKVYKKPRVALFASGNELKMHFESITEYQLYNTNTPTLLSRVKELGGEVEFIGTAQDSLKDLHTHIKSALECDFIITSGGVSVGDADYTKEAFEEFGCDILFDQVAIKPGKPTTFGLIGKTAILNLPGNPLAAALNFEIFAKAILYAMSGIKEKYANTILTKMKEEYQLKAGRRTLIPGVFDGKSFKTCDYFAPGMISPLATANGFIMVDESVEVLKEDMEVKFISTKFEFVSKKQHSLITL